MVREKDVRDAEIWPWRAGEGDAVSANRSRSLRMEDDWRSAELKSAFCLLPERALVSQVLGVRMALVGTNHGGG